MHCFLSIFCCIFQVSKHAVAEIQLYRKSKGSRLWQDPETQEGRMKVVFGMMGQQR